MSSLRRQKVSVSRQYLYDGITLVSRLDPSRRTAPGWPVEAPPAQACTAPQKSSKMAATVLCPKMKVPMSTDTTPQTSRQHLPSQQIHISTYFPGVLHRQAKHMQKTYY